MERPQETDQILSLTLEIICLLTGERCAVVKMASIEGLLQGLYPPLPGGQNPISAPPPASPTPEGNIEQKVLEVIRQVMELLTGRQRGHLGKYSAVKDEVNGNYGEHGGVEKLPDLERDKEAMMEDQPAGGSDQRTSPETRLHPPHHPRDPTQEAQEIRRQEKGEDRIVLNAEAREGGEMSTRNGQRPTKKVGRMATIMPHEAGMKGELEEMSSPCGQRSVREAGREDEEQEEVSRLFTVETIKLEECSGEPGFRIEKSSEEDRRPSPTPTEEDPTEPITFRSPADSEISRSPSEACRYVDNHEEEEIHHSLPECGNGFIGAEDLIQYGAIHSQKKSFPCPECGESFRLKAQLIEHRRSHGIHERERFECSECRKCFSTKAYLNIHQKNHLGLKPYECAECGKFFARKMYLRRHQVRHLGHKPFECAECGKCFVIKPDLLQHLKLHTGERPFSCSVCGKSFSRKSGLHNHRTFHTGEHPYSCTQCGKSFTRNSELRRHIKLHSGVRPYSCSECGKSFARKTHLMIHHRVHTGECPFSCSVCGKSFKCKRVLIKHEKSHAPMAELNIGLPGIEDNVQIPRDHCLPSAGNFLVLNLDLSGSPIGRDIVSQRVGEISEINFHL